MAYKTWPHTPDVADTLQTVLTVEPGKNHIVTHVLITNTDGTNPVDVTIVMLDDADVQQGVLYSNTLASGAHENKRLNVPLPSGYKIAVKASVIDVANFIFVGEEFFTLGADKFPVDALADYAEKFTDTTYMDQAVNDAGEMNLLCSNPVTVNAIAAHPTFWSKVKTSSMALGKFFAGRAGLSPSIFPDITAFMKDDTARPTLLEKPLTYKTQFESDVALGKFLAVESGDLPGSYTDLNDWLNNASSYDQFLADFFGNADLMVAALQDPMFMELIAGMPWTDVRNAIDTSLVVSAMEAAANGDTRLTITTVHSSGDIRSDIIMDGPNDNYKCIAIIDKLIMHGGTDNLMPNYSGCLEVMDATNYDAYGIVLWGGGTIHGTDWTSGENVRVIELA